MQSSQQNASTQQQQQRRLNPLFGSAQPNGQHTDSLPSSPSMLGGADGKSFASSIAQRRLQRRPMQLDTNNGGRLPPSIILDGSSMEPAADAPPPTARGTWTVTKPQTPLLHHPQTPSISYPQTPGSPAFAQHRRLAPMYQTNRFGPIMSSTCSTPAESSEALTSFQRTMGPLSSSIHLKTQTPLVHPTEQQPTGSAVVAGGGHLARRPSSVRHAQPLQQVAGLHYVTAQELAAKMEKSLSGLIIDMRKSADYFAARIAGAINMTAPTTLVKRRTFTVERLLGMLRVTEDQKHSVTNWKAAPWVALHGDGAPEETAAEDTPLVLLARKFMSEAPEGCTVFVLQGGFRDFAAQQKDRCETGSEAAVAPLSLALGAASSSSSSSLSTNGKDISSGSSDTTAMPASGLLSGNSSTLTGNAPMTIDTGVVGRHHPQLSGGLSRPSIVKPKPTVDVDHPMLRKMRQTPGGGFDPTELVAMRLPPDFLSTHHHRLNGDGHSRLPTYLRRAADPPTGPQLLNRLFRCIDASESRRMSSMIGSNGMVTKYNQFTISAGLELGSKNRYTTIFPFDNNRVRLRSLRRPRPRANSTISAIGASGYPTTSTSDRAAGAKTVDIAPGERGLGASSQLEAPSGGSSRPASLESGRDVTMISSDCSKKRAGQLLPLDAMSPTDEMNPGSMRRIAGCVKCLAPSCSCSATNTDYINASYISYFDGPMYIATQGPLPDTVYDLWKMVWEHHTRVIVMLTREFENGRPKCHRYWPDRVGDVATYGDLRVEWQVEAHHPDDGNVVSRRFCVSRPAATDAVMHVTHLQYLGWEDHSVPDTPLGVLRLRQLARSAQREGELEEAKSQKDDDGPQDEFAARMPMVVHCSAGCGRTGAFCVIDTILSMGEKAANIESESLLSATDAAASASMSAPFAAAQRAARAAVDGDGDVDMGGSGFFGSGTGSTGSSGREDMQMLPSGSLYDKHGRYTGLVPQALRSQSSDAAPLSGSSGRHQDSGHQPADDDCDMDKLIHECGGDREKAQKRRSLTRWNELPPAEFHNDLVFMVVSRFRELRVTMVQTMKQFVFCYETLMWQALGMGPRPIERIIDRRLVSEWNRANCPELSEADCVDVTYLMRGRQEMVQAMVGAEMVTSAGSVESIISSGRASIDVVSTGSMLGGGAVGRPPAALAAVKRSNTVGPARRGFFNSIFNRSASNEEPADSSSDGAAVLVQSPQGISAATNNAKQAPPPRMLPSLSSGARLGESVVRPPTASHEPITEESPGAVAEEEAQSKLAATTNSNVFAQAFEAIRNMPKPEFTAATPAVVNRSNMPDDYFGIVCSSSIDGQYVNAVVSPIMSMGMFSQAGGPPTANAADWRRSVLGHLGAAGDENNNRRGGLASMMDGTTPTPGSPSSIYAEGSAALASPRVK